MTAIELIEQTLRASGLPGPTAFAEGGLARLLAGLSRPGISSTALAMPTGNSISAPIGGRSGPSMRSCRHFPTMSR